MLVVHAFQYVKKFFFKIHGKHHHILSSHTLTSDLYQERNKEHFLSFVACQKAVNDARNLEQSVAMVKSRLEKKLSKLLAQKSTDLKLAR